MLVYILLTINTHGVSTVRVKYLNQKRYPYNIANLISNNYLWCNLKLLKI